MLKPVETMTIEGGAVKQKNNRQFINEKMENKNNGLL